MQHDQSTKESPGTCKCVYDRQEARYPAKDMNGIEKYLPKIRTVPPVQLLTVMY